MLFRQHFSMLHPGSQALARFFTARWSATGQRPAVRSFYQTFGTCGLVAIAVLAAGPSQAAQSSTQSRTQSSTRSGKVQPTRPASLPICYIQMPRQSLQSLDKLCGVMPPTKTIPLYAADGLTLTPELLAAVRQFDARKRQAQSEAELLKIDQDLAAQLPLSDRARQLLTQVSSLRQTLERNGYSGPAAEQLSQIQDRLNQDPSYQKAQAAVSDAREALRVQNE
jgi:hypothetical protein